MNSNHDDTINNIISTGGIKRSRKRASLFFSAFILICAALFGTSKVLYPTSQSEISAVTTAPENTTLSVTFLDVGQGNCVIAESAGHYMIIDGGDGSHSSFVVSYLHDLGIETLDYAIISHYDSDHLSGIVGVLHNYNVSSVIAPDYMVDTKTFSSYCSIMKQKNYTAIHPIPGNTFTLGNASFEIVSPVRYTYENENNNSVGIRLTDGSHSFLILGDAEIESESDIVNSGTDLSCDVYMVSHHGSSNASSDKLLDAASPSVAIISVGKNDYGHPDEKTLNRLAVHNIEILRTDKDKTMIAYSGSDFLKWNINFDTKSIQAQKDFSKSSTEASYIGNKNSLKFHLPTCPNLPATSNQIYFKTRDEAVMAGYSPCGVCHP